MDLPETDSVTIKIEPGTLGADGEGISHQNIDIDLPDVKEECLEYSDSVGRMEGTKKNILVAPVVNQSFVCVNPQK